MSYCFGTVNHYDRKGYPCDGIVDKCDNTVGHFIEGMGRWDHCEGTLKYCEKIVEGFIVTVDPL